TPFDGGSSQQPLERLLDIWYRSQSSPDAGGGYKSWITSVFAAGDTILDSVGSDEFWPVDGSGNLLTIESVKLVGDAAPQYPVKGDFWGSYVATLKLNYFPLVNPQKVRY